MNKQEHIQKLQQIAADLIESGVTKTEIENIIFNGNSYHDTGHNLFAKNQIRQKYGKFIDKVENDNVDVDKIQLFTDVDLKVLYESPKIKQLTERQNWLLDKNLTDFIDDIVFMSDLNSFITNKHLHKLSLRSCIFKIGERYNLTKIIVDKFYYEKFKFLRFEFVSIQKDADFKEKFYEVHNNLLSLINATTDSALLIDINGIIIETNDVFAVNNGKTRGEIIGTNVFDLFGKDLRKSRQEKLKQMFDTGEPVKFSDVRDGMYFNISLYPVKNEKGEVYRAAVYAGDKTKEIKALEKLRTSEEKFRHFAEMLPQTVFETNRNQIITFTNINGLRTFGYSYEELQKGINVYDLVHPIEKKRVKQLVKEATSRLGSFSFKFDAITKNGKTFPVAVHGNSIVQDGQFMGVRGIVVDFSKQIEIERALMKSQKELKESVSTKTKLFTILAHDLRGPFAGFINLSETLSTRLEDIKVQDMKEISGALHISAINLYRLLDNLLNWARSQAGAIKVSFELTNVYDICNEIRSYYHLNINQKNIDFSLNCDKDLLVYVDKNMLRTIIRNIISNAIKFVDMNGTIELNAFSSNNNTIIKVSDNGIGIDSTKIDTLYDLKPMEYTSGTMNESGTGLGMAITKEFVDANNGTLRVESIQGEGTVFTIILPTK